MHLAPPPPPPLHPAVHPITETRAHRKETDVLHWQQFGVDWVRLSQRILGFALIVAWGRVFGFPWWTPVVAVLLIASGVGAAIWRAVTTPSRLSGDLTFDSTSVTLTVGRRSKRWSYADAQSWLVGERVTVLYLTPRRPIAIPHDTLPLDVRRSLHAAIERVLGPRLPLRSTFESRQNEPVKLVLAMCAVIGPLLAFAAITVWMGSDRASDPTTAARPADVVISDAGADRVGAGTSNEIVDLTLPLRPEDVPSNCEATTAAAHPVWMCWDATGQPEWAANELPPGCRMVPYGGSMYLDCEGLSGPGR